MPFIDRVAYKHSLKEIPLDVPSQICITRDNTQLQVDGILYFQVTDPMRASYGSSNYIVAVTQLAQTSLRSVIGKLELDKTFEERDIINAQVVAAIDEAALNWGVKVLRYEIKDLTPPKEILHAMQAQITAEREKRALIAASEGRRQEQINIATGEREAFIARSEGEKQAQINNAQGEAAAITAVADCHRGRHRARGSRHPPAGRRTGRAAQGGRARGRRLRQGCRRLQDHTDRAQQHDRDGRADLVGHAHDPDRQKRRPDLKRPQSHATIVGSGAVDERFKSHAWKACEG
jgi:regulator of protease activity HflC (stomatin/prohibitin superfamily)